MTRHKFLLPLFAFLVVLIVLASQSAPVARAEEEGITITPQPTSSPTPIPATPTPTPTSIPPSATPTSVPATATATSPPATATATSVSPTSTSEAPTPNPSPTATSVSDAPTPNPSPTATPGGISDDPSLPPLGGGPVELSSQALLETGPGILADSALFSGMNGMDWFILGLSVLIAIAGFAMLGYGLWLEFDRRSEVIATGVLLLGVVCGVLLFQLMRSMALPVVGRPGSDRDTVVARESIVLDFFAEYQNFLSLAKPTPEIQETTTQPVEHVDVDVDVDVDETPVERLVIPSLNLDVDVRATPFRGDTWDISDLGHAVGWLEHTSTPGLGGNTVLAGHITVPNEGNGPFIYLRALDPGEKVIVYTGENVYTYQVREQQVVKPEDSWVVGGTDKAQLTLLTCTDWDSANFTYTNRRIVVAVLVEVQQN